MDRYIDRYREIERERQTDRQTDRLTVVKECAPAHGSTALRSKQLWGELKVRYAGRGV